MIEADDIFGVDVIRRISVNPLPHESPCLMA
jgi:hypothetical protein